MRALPDYAAVVLAAGRSRRMRGENKLLKDYRGRPLLAHALATVQQLGLGDVVLVVGHDAGRVIALGCGMGVRFVETEDAVAGMGHSIASGVMTLPEGLAGIFIVLGDMPDIAVTDYQRLAEAHAAKPDRICVPVWAERRGHPVLFGADYSEALTRLSGDTGARALLRSHSDEVVSVAASSRGVVLDFDTPADFEPGSQGH